MTVPTGWQPMDTCPKDRDVTLWATHLPTGESCCAVRGYFRESQGWIARGDDEESFTKLYPQSWLPV